MEDHPFYVVGDEGQFARDMEREDQMIHSEDKTKPLTTPPPLFPTGNLVATPGAVAALARNDAGWLPLIERHVRGDWGTVDEHDRVENDFAARNGFRVLSAYNLADGTTVWLITEADRSVTTILLPEDY